MYLLFSQDIYKVLDDVLGQGAHTTVKTCVKLATNQEYAVKVKELSCYGLYCNLIVLWSSFYYVSLENIYTPPLGTSISLWKFHFSPSKVKSAYKPSGSSGQSLSWLL